VLVDTLGLLVFEATGADISDLGEEHGLRVLHVCQFPPPSSAEKPCAPKRWPVIMAVMQAVRVDEDWSEQDLDMLLELAFANVAESQRCHEADCPLAAFVMLAAAFEATLLGMVIAHEDALRADGIWPIGASRKHLTELAGLAGERGWLTGEDVWGVVEVLNKARTMAAHPGAYVRGMRSAPADLDLRDSDGYRACLEIVVRATGQLRAAHDAILRTAGT
jgi:hypothetical protein